MSYSSEQIAEIASRSISVGGVAKELSARSAVETGLVKEYQEALDALDVVQASGIFHVINPARAKTLREKEAPRFLKEHTDKAERYLKKSDALEDLAKQEEESTE